MMAAFNGEMFVVKPRWSEDCFSVNIVRKLVDKIIPKVVTMDELKEAIKVINTGKSEDIYGLSIENIIYAGEEFLHHLLDLIMSNRCNFLIRMSMLLFIDYLL
jgi:hypothetical protein